MMMMRGAFVVFEGIDRCGKTTQTSKLVSSLHSQGISSELMRFPNRDTTIGKILNSYLTSKENLEDQSVHLLFSANRWESKSIIEKKLLSGTTLIVDRYAFSGVAFTSAKGLDLEWCKNPDRGLPNPDLVVYMEMPIEEASKRGQYGQERYENESFQRIVKQRYESLKEPSWLIVNAGQSIEEVHSIIHSAVLRVIKESKDKHIGKLWI